MLYRDENRHELVPIVGSLTEGEFARYLMRYLPDVGSVGILQLVQLYVLGKVDLSEVVSAFSENGNGEVPSLQKNIFEQMLLILGKLVTENARLVENAKFAMEVAQTESTDSRVFFAQEFIQKPDEKAFPDQVKIFKEAKKENKAKKKAFQVHLRQLLSDSEKVTDEEKKIFGRRINNFLKLERPRDHDLIGAKVTLAGVEFSLSVVKFISQQTGQLITIIDALEDRPEELKDASVQQPEVSKELRSLIVDPISAATLNVAILRRLEVVGSDKNIDHFFLALDRLELNLKMMQDLVFGDR